MEAVNAMITEKLNTTYLTRQCSSTVEQLHELFNDIGVDTQERDQREAQVFQALIDTLHAQVKQVTQEKLSLTNEASELIRTLHSYKVCLGIEGTGKILDDDTGELSQVSYPLRECINSVRGQLDVLKQYHAEKFEEVKKVIVALLSYSCYLESTFLCVPLPPGFRSNDPYEAQNVSSTSCPPNFLLNDQYVSQLNAEFTRVYEEYIARLNTVKRLAQEIITLWAELDTPDSLTDPQIIQHATDSPEQLGLRRDDVKRLQSSRDKLVQEKRVREKKKASLIESIHELWERLGAVEDDRREFISSNPGVGLRTMRVIEGELNRLNELKRQNMGLFVEEARCRLQALWDELYFSEEQMLAFAPAWSDFYTDALLSAHETEIARLRELVAERRPLLNLIGQHQRLVEDRLELEASSQDASRLMLRGQKGEKRDPGKLLREEKMRKRLAKELPRVERELYERLSLWEEEKQERFLIRGERYLDQVSRPGPLNGKRDGNNLMSRVKTPISKLTVTNHVNQLNGRGVTSTVGGRRAGGQLTTASRIDTGKGLMLQAQAQLKTPTPCRGELGLHGRTGLGHNLSVTSCSVKAKGAGTHGQSRGGLSSTMNSGGRLYESRMNYRTVRGGDDYKSTMKFPGSSTSEMLAKRRENNLSAGSTSTNGTCGTNSSTTLPSRLPSPIRRDVRGGSLGEEFEVEKREMGRFPLLSATTGSSLSKSTGMESGSPPKMRGFNVMGKGGGEVQGIKGEESRLAEKGRDEVFEGGMCRSNGGGIVRRVSPEDILYEGKGLAGSGKTRKENEGFRGRHNENGGMQSERKVLYGMVERSNRHMDNNGGAKGKENRPPEVGSTGGKGGSFNVVTTSNVTMVKRGGRDEELGEIDRVEEGFGEDMKMKEKLEEWCVKKVKIRIEKEEKSEGRGGDEGNSQGDKMKEEKVGESTDMIMGQGEQMYEGEAEVRQRWTARQVSASSAISGVSGSENWETYDEDDLSGVDEVVMGGDNKLKGEEVYETKDKKVYTRTNSSEVSKLTMLAWKKGLDNKRRRGGTLLVERLGRGSGMSGLTCIVDGEEDDSGEWEDAEDDDEDDEDQRKFGVEETR